MAYDTKCHDLAKSFLADQWSIGRGGTLSEVKEKITDKLAQRIQDEIENFIEEEFT